MKHRGGAEKKIIPNFKEPKNSPFVSKNEKDLRQQKFHETHPKKFLEPPLYNKVPSKDNQIVDLQIYDTKKISKPTVEPSLYVPFTNTTTPYVPPQYSSLPYDGMPFFPGKYGLRNIPFVKQYNINIDGPTADHTRVNTIFEDMLPREHFGGTLDTISERFNLHNLIRSSLMKKGDGEDIDLDGAGDNSILKYIKFIHLNPFNSLEYTANPYKSLPNGFLVYSSCYPIRYASDGNYVKCAKNSVGILVKIYEMKDKNVDWRQSELWREVKYYEFVRDKIVKDNKCPNIAFIYGYFICKDCKFDFDKLSTITGKPNNTKNIPSKEALVALAEAPTQNLLQWGRDEWISKNGIQTKVSHGYHNSDVWKSVLFQIMVALYSLQYHKFAFSKFDVFNNIFIKDTQGKGNTNKHWRYKIDQLQYYVPNHGYVVLFDSTFADTDLGEHKIYGDIYGDDHELIKDKCFDMFKEAFNVNRYLNNAQNQGFITPPDDIIKLLTSITDDFMTDRHRNISYYIHKYMTFFLNNRIGTLLRGNEVNNIRKDEYDLKVGKLVVHEVRYKTYKFVIIKEFVDNKRKAIIITRDDETKYDNIEEKEVRVETLFNYSKYESINQDFKSDVNLSSSGLLETYFLN